MPARWSGGRGDDDVRRRRSRRQHMHAFQRASGDSAERFLSANHFGDDVHPSNGAVI